MKKTPKYFYYGPSKILCRVVGQAKGKRFAENVNTGEVFIVVERLAYYLPRFNYRVYLMAEKGTDPKEIAKKLKITLRAVQYTISAMKKHGH